MRQGRSWTRRAYSGLRNSVAAGKIKKAVGEIGLDYYWEEQSPRYTRKNGLRHRWIWPGEVKLPVIIHSRDAAKDTLDMMKAAKAGDIGGVVHCFSYTREMAREYLNMGFSLESEASYLQQCKEAERGGGVYTSGVHCIGDRLSLSGAGSQPRKEKLIPQSSLCGGGCQPAREWTRKPL